MAMCSSKLGKRGPKPYAAQYMATNNAEKFDDNYKNSVFSSTSARGTLFFGLSSKTVLNYRYLERQTMSTFRSLR